jgi:hypothetical protein
MTCDDYLSMLETLPVGELNYGEARDHVATCRDCNRVTRVVAERERNMIGAYGELYPSASAVTVAEQAMLTSRRRRVALLYRATLGAAAVAVVAFIGLSRIRPRAVPAMAFQQNFMVHWCNAEQVAAMLEGNLSPATSITIRPGTSVLHVAGRPSDLRVVRSLLNQYDNGNGNCAAMAVPMADPMVMPMAAGMPAAAVRARARAKFQVDADRNATRDAARAAAARP